MKIILAGASGQIGRILLRDFARENIHDLVVLTRDPTAFSTAAVTSASTTSPAMQRETAWIVTLSSP
jgi:uncharacterized protein YbjT (DUF2867 family)